MRRRRKRADTVVRRRRILLAVGLLLLIVLLNFRATPLVETSVRQQAEQLAAESVSEVTLQILAEMDCAGGQFINVEREDGGAIRSIGANMQQINRFQAEMTQKMQQAVAKIGQRSLKVALGTLLGGNFLRDRGPKLTLRFSVASSVRCELTSDFTSAGINQTKHSVNLTVHTTVYAMIPFCAAEVESTATFCIAEEIIVGAVPDLYLNRNLS